MAGSPTRGSRSDLLRILSDRGRSANSIEDLTDLYYYDEKYPFNSVRDNRFEAGAVIGLGLQYEINDLLTVLAECRYYYSLTDMQKDYMKMQVPRYLNTMLFQVGLLVTLDD